MNTIFKGLSQDIVNKLLEIPELEGRVGLSLGGKGTDPNLLKCPIPLAWPVMEGCKSIDVVGGKMPKRQSIECFFSVFLISEYKDQNGLLNDQLPLIESCIQAVAGSVSPSGTTWGFDSWSIRTIDTDRQVHEIKFCVTSHIQSK